MPNISEELIRLITTKGWLSVAEITFDNTVRLPIATSEGLVCINETKGHMYFIDQSGAGGPLSFAYQANSGLIDGYGSDLSAFQEVRIIDMNTLQNFSMQTWLRTGGLEAIVSDGKDIPLPTINTKTPVFDDDMKTMIFGDLSALAEVPGLELRSIDGLYITKPGHDRFTIANTKFKAYVKSLLGLTTDVLV